MKIVVLTGYGIIPTAVEAIKSGATYYLTKLTDVDKVVGAFAREKGEANVELGEPLSFEIFGVGAYSKGACRL